MSFDNYPDGAANDPRAPYNQKELPEFEPERCRSCGNAAPICQNNELCEACSFSPTPCKSCKTTEEPLNSDEECEDCFIERVSEEPPGRDYDQEAKDQRLEDEHDRK